MPYGDLQLQPPTRHHSSYITHWLDRELNSNRTPIKPLKATICLLVLGIGIGFTHIASAATNVYYSVGQSAADLSNNGSSQTCTVGGDCALTISSGTATLNFAQTGNIGVGDRITYNTSSISYISGKISQTQWTLITRTGGTPTDVTGATVNSINREYTSLSAAEAGAADANHINNTSLVATDVVLNLTCYYDTGADTTAVTIDGWTTDATRYITVYTPNNTMTEANSSQRHSGKWDDGKYRIEVTNPSDGVIYVREDYVRIEGLQIHSTTSSEYTHGISTVNAWSPAGDVRVSNNIVRGNRSGVWNQAGIFVFLMTGTTKTLVWNNIIYDFGMGIWSYDNRDTAYVYAYNNTITDIEDIYNYQRGIWDHSGNRIVAKNNIVSDCGNTQAYEGTFRTGSDYNATDGTDDIGQGTHNRISQTFAFVDAPNFDFHLSEDDTAALDAGTDLSGDLDLPITTDIDGNARTGTWDIGADEFGSATPLHRSVGTTATNLNTDNRTVTITGTTATFSDSMPNNIGVGDVLQYQVIGTYYLAFIYERRSPTVYRVRSAAGTAPQAAAGGTSVGVYRAYTSQGGQGPLYNWEEQDENDNLDDTVENFDTSTDLVANDTIMNAACYGDGADTTAVTINGWTTGADNYIKVYTPRYITEVGTSQRHSGKWDDGKYRIVPGGDTLRAIEVQEDHTTIVGIQIKNTSYNADNRDGIDIISGSVSISQNIISEANPAATGNARHGIHVADGFTNPVFIENNIIDGFRGPNGTGIWVGGWYGYNGYAYNNSIYNCAYGIALARDGYLNLKNNISYNNTDNYAGIFNASSTNNLSGPTQADAPGSNPQNAKTVAFIDETGADFHLMETDAYAKDHGTDLSLDPNISFTDDIDGDARTGTWDIGADEAYNSIKINGGVKVNGGVRVERQ